MKKLLILAVVLSLGFNVWAQDGNDSSSNGGGFYAGINAGLPIGDAGDFTTFAIAIDLGYLFEISDDVSAGVTTGYAHWFAEDMDGFEIDDLQFAPIAGTVEFDLSDDFSAGGDIGYAINLGSGGGGDFYYRPFIAYSVSDDGDVTASFANISGSGSTWSAVQVGYRFKF